PRRRDVEQAGAEDRAKPNPPRDHDAVSDRMVRAGVELRPPVAEMATVERDFGTQPTAEPEAPRRVEQAVAAVIADGERGGSDQEPACVLDPGAAEHPAFDGSEPLATVGPGPLLLPDEVALALDVACKV